jgi:hypothetical protein
MASVRVEHDPLYIHKHLSVWLLAFATYAYQSLGTNWPKTPHEWTIFVLGAVVYVLGGVQSYSGATKAANNA